MFRQGEPALNFYSVEKGTLDVVRTNDDGSEQLVAVIGPGTSSERWRSSTRPQRERAGTNLPVEVTALGAQVFSRISQALAPLQQRLAEAIRQRTVASPWTRMPLVHAMLSAERVSSFVEPGTLYARCRQHVRTRSRSSRASRRHGLHRGRRRSRRRPGTDCRRDHPHRSVSCGGPRGSSTVTERRSASIRSLMSPDPLVMTMDDTVAAAALAMWSRGLKESAGSDRRERASGWLHSCRDGDAGGPGRVAQPEETLNR